MVDIRALTPQDDLAIVGQIYAESWKDCYRGLLPQSFLNKLTPERWTAVIAAAPHRTAVLWLNGQPVGAATVGFCRDKGREGYGEIISLYLLPGTLGQGVSGIFQHL